MIGAALAVALALAAQPADTLVYLPLDGSTEPQVGAGPVEVEGEARFSAAVVGQGLVCGEGGAALRLPLRGNLRPAAGCVAMWIKPLDWEPDDGKFHVFFEAKQPGWVLLYKYYSGPPRILLLLSDDTEKHGWQYISGDISQWKAGRWHHVAACWDARQARLYLDGKRVASMDGPPVPVVETDAVEIGDRPWHIQRRARSLLDEVYVFGRPLTDAEVAALYEAGRAGRPAPERLAAVPAVSAYLIPKGWRRQYVAMVDLSGLSPAARAAARVSGRLVAPDGRVAWKGRLGPVAGHLASGHVPLAFKPPGRWRLAATVSARGQELTGTASFDMPDTSWMGTHLYSDFELLPPWTPLSASGATVRVWGRQQTLSPVGYKSLRILGRDVLAGPCRLEATVGGREVSADGGELRLVHRSEARAVFEARAKVGPLVWRARIVADFDGLVRFDGRLLAERPARISSLRLVIPLRGDMATLFNHCSRSWGEHNAGAVPGREGVVWQTEKFVPFVWLGNEDCGVMWFCESERGWKVGKGRSPIYLRRDGRQVSIVVEPISAPVGLAGQWNWTYGLMATPVKPLPRRWRKYRWEPGVRANISIVWPHPTLMRYFGYPAAAADESKFRALVERKHRSGTMVVPYSCLTYISQQAPEWKLFSDYWWVTGVADRTSSDVGQFHAAFMAVCPRADGLSDFMVWANKRFMEKYRLDGLYHDCTFAYPCSNRLHGCGWIDETGASHRQYPIFAHRELYRRVYAMMKGLGRPTYMVAHMSSRMLMPVLSFTDAYLDGEQFRGRYHYVKDYRDVLTLEFFRGEFMGRQWGLMPVFLPELAEEARNRRGTRTLLVFTLLHDVPVWAIWCDRRAVDELRKPLDDFGYVEARFVPYWHEPARADAPDVFVSAYCRDGRALLVVGNIGRKDRRVHLELNRGKLGLGAGALAATDAEANADVDVSGGRLSVAVPAGDLRLVRVAIRP